MPTQGARRPVATVSTLVLRALVAAVERAGLSRSQFLRAAGIDEAQLEAAELRVQLSEVRRLCELAVDLSGDPALGLHWAETLTGATFVPVSHMIAHAATLRQGLESLARYSRLLSDEPGYQLSEHGERVTLTIPPSSVPAPSLRAHRFCAEITIVGFFRVLGSFCREARLESVCFDYPAPAYAAEYARILGPPVRFDQPRTEMVFPRALLELPSPNRDAGVHEALQQVAERRVAILERRRPYAQRVHDYLVSTGWRERADMGDVAQALRISVRTLRRRLADEGKTYGDVESAALARVAQRLLREGCRTVQETAYEMGFSNSSAFHRAFKRWTGTTPSAYQQGR